MKEYIGFWMKKEFAYHYFHKSGILYRFIKSYQQEKYRADLVKQYCYMTNSFSVDKLIAYIQNTCPSSANVLAKGNQLELYRNMQSMSLHIHEKHLNFRCETLHDAEELLFPSLRLFHPFLFIVENNTDNFGWISPISMNREYKQEQVLYSYL